MTKDNVEKHAEERDGRHTEDDEKSCANSPKPNLQAPSPQRDGSVRFEEPGHTLSDALKGLQAAVTKQKSHRQLRSGEGLAQNDAASMKPLLSQGEEFDVLESISHPLSAPSSLGDLSPRSGVVTADAPDLDIPTLSPPMASLPSRRDDASAAVLSSTEDMESQDKRPGVTPQRSLPHMVGGGGKHARHISALSLRSVMEHRPLESEAEAHLQSALDELDPTKPNSTGTAIHTILDNVPTETEPSAFENPTPSADDQSLPVHVKSDPKEARKTTHQQLREVTKGLQKMQNVSRALKSSAASSIGRARGTDTEALVKNATKLVSSAVDNSSQETTSNESNENNMSGSILNSPNSKSDKVANRQLNNRTLQTKAHFKDLEEWMAMRRRRTLRNVKITLAIIVIAAGLASLLFYGLGNPPCANGICNVKVVDNKTSTATIVTASASWWILFLFVRQVVTFSLARVTMIYMVEFLCLRTKIMVRMFGPLVALMITQGKGWPLILVLWSIFDACLLVGDYPFAKHWLFWQDEIDMWNESNPAGTVTSAPYYIVCVVLAAVVGLLVMIKRCIVGISLGQQAYAQLSEDLAHVIKKAMLIAEVASLARDMELSKINLSDFGLHVDTEMHEGLDDDTCQGQKGDREVKVGIMEGVDLSSRRVTLNQLLGEWEQPDEKQQLETATVGAIIQFRQSLSLLSSSILFGSAFGSITNRQQCLECSEALYNRLLAGTPGANALSFDIIALLALEQDGDLNEEKLRALIRLFRPDRDGTLTLLDFAKSIDAVYKESRLLRASAANLSKLDKAYERVINFFFYFILLYICAACLGVNPVLLFGSISGFIVGFAFMIGSACSKYVEGLLLIFVRRPYNIGDRIALADPTDALPITGSAGFIVKDIDLFSTTLIYGATNEVASFNNGSLANCRIINAARSPKANITIYLKFPIDTPFEALNVFKSALEKFVKARPRQWAAFLAFRPSRVEADLGFVEYSVISQHREPWQSIGDIVNTKAELESFSLELMKKMGLRYHSPPMPVDLTINSGHESQIGRGSSPGTPIFSDTDRTATDYAAVASMFGVETTPVVKR